MSSAGGQPAQPRFDVFMSFSRADREPVRRLVAAMRRAGLRVFLDEAEIPYFHGITPEIKAALSSTKIVAIYYSQSYPTRPPCQVELTAAFLAGQAEGDPARRIVVINPEPGLTHLQPAELADARFAVLPAPGQDRHAMDVIVAAIRARVDAVPDAIQEVDFAQRPRWRPERVAGAPEFIGRYRELWQVHSKLVEWQLPMTQDVTGAPVVTIVGLPGIGKSALAAAYGWRFGAAHPGGVFWLSLAGTAPSTVAAHYADLLRSVADELQLPTARATRAQVLGMLADWVAAQPGPVLWIIDDLPPDLGPDVVNTLVLPAGTNLRMLMTSQRVHPNWPWPTVKLGPMPASDAATLLQRFRPAQTAADRAGLNRVVRRLNGHTQALRLAGVELEDRQGLMSYARYADLLDTDPSTVAVVAEPLRRALGSLDPTQELVLQLSVVCSPAALPVQLIERALGALGSTGPDPTRAVGAALAGLQQRLLASRADTLWEVHSLIRDAAREHLPATYQSTVEIAPAAAAAIVELLDGAQLPALARTLLIRHGEALAARGDLPSDRHEALLRRITGYYDMRGEPILSVPHWERILGYHPDDPRDLVAAAAAQHHTGQPELALAHAVRALSLAGDDVTLRRRCHLIQAEALDALGQPTEADRHWTVVLPTGSHGAATAESLSARIAQARSLRLRGRLPEARRLLHALVDTQPATVDTTVLDLGQEARIELALAQLMTDDQFGARLSAAAVLAHYHARGLPHHRHALAAQQVFADAQQTMHLWELQPDRTAWPRAEQSMRELRDHYRQTHGPHNAFTLSASVAHAQAQVSLGDPVHARQELTALIPDVQARFGPRHPLYFRACFLLGQAHAQLGDYRSAAPLYETAFAGQRAALGPSHPYTLRTQFELGIALKITGDTRRAKAMIRTVRRTAPHSTGRTTDLFAQSVVATILMPLPTWIWRRIGKVRSH